MSFLSPVFLMGLPLIVVPVLIHLFGKRRRELIRWGAMEFLLASATPRRRLLKLKDLLLMLARAAIVLAIVSALAQPMITSKYIGTIGPRDVILVLDNSLSTSRQVGNHTVFDRELDEVEKLLSQLTGTDRVRVLLASPTPDWFDEAPVAADALSARGLLSRLRELRPSTGSADMLDCAQAALKAASAGSDMPRFVTFITDGQAHGWRTEAASAWSAIDALAKKTTPPAFTRVMVVAGDGAAGVNLAVEGISATRTVAGAGQPVTFTAAVKNVGSVPSAGTTLEWRAGDQVLGISSVPPLEAGAGTTLKLNQAFATPGPVNVEARLTSQDELPLDNSSRFLVEITKSVPVLLVEGETKTDPMESDTRFFLTALGYDEQAQSRSAVRSVFEPKVIDYRHLPRQNLAGFQCVVLANVPRLSPETSQALADYVNAGGGLWMALGDQTDVEAFNQLLFEKGAGLSPLALGKPIGDAEDHEKFITLVPPSAEHPATALLADIQRLDIDRVHVYRRHQFDIPRDATVSVLLRASGGAPVAVEKNLGRGRIIVQSVPLGLTWSSLPLSHAFVVMAHEWLWYLAEPGLVKRNLQVGEPIQLSQPMESSDGVCALQTSDGRQVHLVGLEQGRRFAFRYSRTQLPGEYRVVVAGGRTELFFVNRDPAESNLKPLSAEQLKSLSTAGGLDFGSAPLAQPAGQPVPAAPRALAQWLLVALVGLMAIEAVVAFWLVRRRQAGSPPVALQPSIHA